LELREYQQDALQEIKNALSSGKKAPLLVLPTGAGKTIIFTELSKYLIKQKKKVLILVHRRELVKQACQKLDEMNNKYGVIAPSYPSTNNSLQVASVYTLSRRMHTLKFIPDYIIFDEAHHVAAKTWIDVVNKYKKAKRIGVTATPIRLDGKSLKGYFDVLINGPDVIDLVSKGYLCKHKVYASPHKLDFSNLKLKRNDYLKKDIANIVKDKVITGNAISHYKKYLLNKPTVVFCVDIPHAQTILERFLSEGIKAALLTGDTLQNERDKILDDLKNNIIHVVISIDVISEGTDLPCVEGAILLRPTNSEALYRQQVGRILRPGKNKTAIVLDHVNNTITHGFVDEFRDWTLDLDIPYGQKKKNPLVRTCKQCNHVFKFAKSCPECGFSLTKNEIKEIEGELEELQKEETLRKESSSESIKQNFKDSIYSQRKFLNSCLKSIELLNKKHTGLIKTSTVIDGFVVGDNVSFYKGQNQPTSGVFLGAIDQGTQPKYEHKHLLPPIPEKYKKQGFKDYWFPDLMKPGMDIRELPSIELNADLIDIDKYKKGLGTRNLNRTCEHYIDCLIKYKNQIQNLYYWNYRALQCQYSYAAPPNDKSIDLIFGGRHNYGHYKCLYTYLINKKNNEFIHFDLEESQWKDLLETKKEYIGEEHLGYKYIVLTDQGIELLDNSCRYLHEKKQRELIRNIYSKKQNSMDDFINIARNGYFKVGYNQDWVYRNYFSKKLISKFENLL